MFTKKLYDIDAYATEFEATVISCKEELWVGAVDETGKYYEVILDQTLFFPEEGGQTSDIGTLGEGIVFHAQIKNDVIIHSLSVPLQIGEKVKGKIDWKHRFYNMQQHSGEHLFSGLAYRWHGLNNVGFHLSNQIVTMDFDGVLTEEQIKEMEWAVNEAIVANAEVKTYYPSKEELAELEYRSKKEIEGALRIVEIEGYDMCACCAPHVKRTGEIGSFKIQSVQKYKSGIRISFLCGFRALEEYRKKAEIISNLTGILTTNQDNLADHVTKMKDQIFTLKSELSNAKKILMESKIAEIPAEQKDVVLFEKDLDTSDMRNTVNKLMEVHTGVCGVFVGTDKEGYNYIIGSRTVDCREVANVLRTELQARGGGSAQMIQGSVMASRESIIGRLTR